ncbi:MAG: M28 family peptidase, partial [Planctomycetota bacterium]|nr:M28 family peptidase [Planctomycetota bacterium]
MKNPSRLAATNPWVLGRLALVTLFCVVALLRAVAEEPAGIEKRLSDTVRYLASDQLEGRGVGTQGLDLAAEFIARQFAEAGLKTQGSEGGPFQKFTFNLPPELGKDNRLTLVGPPLKPGEKPQTIELTVGKDFLPLAASGATSFDRPLAFTGYGITAKAEKYDDFQGIDVSGKIVIVLRHEPQQDDSKSVFDGTRESAYARLDRKVAAALEHQAAGVIVCTDALEIRKHVAQRRKSWLEALDRLAAEHQKLKQADNPTLEQTEAQRKQIEELMRQVDAASKTIEAQYDPLLPLGQLHADQTRQEFPVMQCRRAVLDRAVQAALDTDLAKLEQQIDQGPTPHSKDLTGWKAVGKTDIGSQKIALKNVAAVLEGQGSLADETIVVGAHYDHLGYGGPGSRNANPKSIYYGADDNASGIAVLIEVARTLAQRPEKLARRVVFVAFTAEETGL